MNLDALKSQFLGKLKQVYNQGNNTQYLSELRTITKSMQKAKITYCMTDLYLCR